jgi:hypothetical protein
MAETRRDRERDGCERATLLKRSGLGEVDVNCFDARAMSELDVPPSGQAVA